jgi:serine protease Do
MLAALFVGAPASGIAPSLAASPVERAAPSIAAPDLDRLSEDLQTLSRGVSPAVVQIFVSSIRPSPRAAEIGGGLLSRLRGSGSGVIVDPTGYIVTNAHVVAGASGIQVQLAEPRSGAPGHSILRPAGPRREARIVGMDQETDIAVIKIEGVDLPTLSFADSDQLRQGQIALAFGSPLGLESSVSLGVISATVRQLEPDSPMIYLQTDAAIHPGNSGGPLVDTQGAVVGINTFVLSSPAGDAVGFAAPSNIVSAVYRQIREHGRVRRGVIGARAQTITAELAPGLGLDRDWGVILADVYPGGPAERAGLRPGDVVVSLDGKAMENGRQLDVNLYRHAAGEEITLEILREGERRLVRLTLSERAGDVDHLAAFAHPEEHLIDALQILAVPVDERLAQMVPIRWPWGVLVALSTEDAPPGGAPLLPGDVIRSINRASVRSLEDLRRGLAAHPAGSWVTLHVERGGRMIFVPVEIP